MFVHELSTKRREEFGTMASIITSLLLFQPVRPGEVSALPKESVERLLGAVKHLLQKGVSQPDYVRLQELRRLLDFILSCPRRKTVRHFRRQLKALGIGPFAACAHATCSQGPVGRCSRCNAAVYCSRSCQRLEWPLHRLLCVSSNDA